jgi:hypothetical protein
MGKREVKDVKRDVSPMVPFGPDWVYTTEITDNKGNTYTGHGWDRKEANKNAGEKYNKNERNSKSGGGSGCFITTACLEAKGLGDTCPELNALRIFRDEYVRKVPAGEQIIEEYYRIAPYIVANINSRRNSKRIYHSLYRRLVQKSLGLLLLGKKQEALDNYITTVEDLKRKYFFPTIWQ